MPYTAERLRSRHPFQIYVLTLMIAYGVAGLLNRHAQPGSVRETLGHYGALVWQIFLVLGSVSSVVGVFWRNRASGLVMEALGCLAAGAATAYAAGILLYVVGLGATLSACVLFGFGVACVVRAWQIRRVLAQAARQAHRRGK